MDKAVRQQRVLVHGGHGNVVTRVLEKVSEPLGSEIFVFCCYGIILIMQAWLCGNNIINL